jgi:hypothetical protein
VDIDLDEEANRLENIIEESFCEFESESSNLSPLKLYQNDDELRMSEERLLAKLQSDEEFEIESSAPPTAVPSPTLSERGGGHSNRMFAGSNGAMNYNYGNNSSLITTPLPRSSPTPSNNIGQTNVNLNTPSPGRSRPPSLQFASSNSNGSFSKYSSNLWTSHDNSSLDEKQQTLLRHECDEKCGSELHKAAKTGSIDLMEYRLEVGDDPNAKDCMGRTPLHWAVCVGKTVAKNTK